MVEVREIVEKVRSKNAGPFWLTIDIFCGSDDAFERIAKGVASHRVAEVFKIDAGTIKRFDIAALNVVKFSFPRPVVQGMRADRDMHGAGWAVLIAEMTLDT